LRAEGYLPALDDDADIVFNSEGPTFLLLVDGKDSEFFRLTIPNFLSIDDEDKRERVRSACLEVTRAVKVVKVFPVENDTRATVEMFVSPILSAPDVFRRCLRCLHYAMQAFHKEMRGLQLNDEDRDEN
jgi:hypothetical protein